MSEENLAEIEKDSEGEICRVSDLEQTAYLWLQPGIDVVNVMRHKFIKQGRERSQTLFVLKNKSNKSVKDYLLEYCNQRAIVEVCSYNHKLKLVRDLVNHSGESKTV